MDNHALASTTDNGPKIAVADLVRFAEPRLISVYTIVFAMQVAGDTVVNEWFENGSEMSDTLTLKRSDCDVPPEGGLLCRHMEGFQQLWAGKNAQEFTPVPGTFDRVYMRTDLKQQEGFLVTKAFQTVGWPVHYEQLSAQPGDYLYVEPEFKAWILVKPNNFGQIVEDHGPKPV